MSGVETLSPDRFRALTEAYGGIVARWPDEVRAEALQLAAQPRFATILAEEAVLDAWLDDWREPSPSATLSATIAAGAPRRRFRLRSRARLWWSSIGLATTLAGVAAGSLAAAAVVPVDHGTAENMTAFGYVANGEM